MIYGLDVSAYQPTRFPLTTPGDNHPVDFDITKITEGLTYVNPRWVGQRQWARDHGLVWGAYHYPHMANDPVREADRFLSVVAWQPGDVIVLDWEGYDAANRDVPKSTQRAYKRAWLDYVRGLMPDHQVGMYANTDYWKNVDQDSYCGDFLWIATSGYRAGDPPITYDWTIHQYSTAQDYDHDVARFDSRADMLAWALKEDDVALSDTDKNWLRSEIRAAVKEIVYTKDGFLLAPPDAADYNPDPASPQHYWSGATHTQAQTTTVRAVQTTLDKEIVPGLADIIAQARMNGASLTALLADVASVDQAIRDALLSKLQSLKVTGIVSLESPEV